MKPAVFQVHEADGSVHLVCFYMRSLADAVDLERTLRQLAGPRIEVKLLGRFHRIQMARNTEEMIALVLGALRADPERRSQDIELRTRWEIRLEGPTRRSD